MQRGRLCMKSERSLHLYEQEMPVDCGCQSPWRVACPLFLEGDFLGSVFLFFDNSNFKFHFLFLVPKKSGVPVVRRRFVRRNLSPPSTQKKSRSRVHIMIASEGYLHVPQCIEDQALHALRAEADSLFNLKRSSCALSEDEYFDKVSNC